MFRGTKHLSRFAGLVLTAILVLPQLAVADLLVGNFGGFGPSIVRRYRESDGAFLNNAGFGDETIQDIQLGPDGRLYVAGNGLGAGAVRRFDWANGAFLGFLVSPAQNGYRSPNGFAFGTDSSLYATSQDIQMAGGTTGLMKFNGTTGAYLGLFVAPGSGGIGTPFDVIVQPITGDLLVSDGSRINRYNKTTGAFVSTFLAAGAGGMNSFGQSIFGPDGNFYVSNFSQDVVARFNGQTGAFMGNLIAPGGVVDPRGIAFGPDGNLYVCAGAFGNISVQRYNGTTGAFIDTFINDQTNLPTATFLLFTPEPSGAMMMCVVALACRARRWTV